MSEKGEKTELAASEREETINTYNGRKPLCPKKRSRHFGVDLWEEKREFPVQALPIFALGKGGETGNLYYELEEGAGTTKGKKGKMSDQKRKPFSPSRGRKEKYLIGKGRLSKTGCKNQKMPSTRKGKHLSFGKGRNP